MKNIDRKVNLKSINFFYSDENSIENFLLEMNNVFSYQTIVFVNASENIKNDLIEKAKKIKNQTDNNFNVKFEFVACVKNSISGENMLNTNLQNIFNKNIEDVVNKEDVCALVCFEEKFLQDCAKICRQFNKKMIVYFQDYVSLNYFNPNILDAQIIGVVVSKNDICQNIKTFAQKLCYEMGTMLFFDMENYINSLCFVSKQDYINKNQNCQISKCEFEVNKQLNFKTKNQIQNPDNNNEEQFDFKNSKQDYNQTKNEYLQYTTKTKSKDYNNELQDFLHFELIENIMENFEVEYDKLIDNYVSLINVFIARNSSIFDDFFKNLMQAGKPNFEYFSCIFGEILLNLYNIFLKKFTPKLKSYLEIGAINLICYNSFFEFENNFDETRFWFVMAKLKQNLQNNIENCLLFIENIKQKCYLIDIYSTCETLKKCDFGFVKQIIKEISFSNFQNSLLKIIDYYGCLQF